MKRTVFSRIFSGHFIVVALLTIAVMAFSFRTIRAHYLETLTTNLLNIAASLEDRVSPLIGENPQNLRELDSLARKLGKTMKVRLTVTDAKGTVLADSEMPPPLMENLANRPEIAEAMQGKTGTALRFSTILKEEMLYVAIPLKKDGAIQGILRTSIFIKDVNGLLDQLKANILGTAAVILLASLLLAFFFSRTLSRSLKQLVEVSRKIAGGDFEVKVASSGEAEFNALADAFNDMSSRINELFLEVSCRKENLNSIVSSIHEGLVVLNYENRIAFGNDSFRKIANQSAIDGKPLSEVMDSPEFSLLLQEAGSRKDRAMGEIQLNGRQYLCNIAYLCCFSQVVATLQDITEIRNLEKMKKAIVSNVSHELRTPLTAIKGFTETLLEGEKNDDDRRYLEIILKNADRLIGIVSDLLVLSELEEEKFELRLEKVDLEELIKDAGKTFEQKLKEKKLHFSVMSKEPLPAVEGDIFKLEQVFVNLIDNAIKYTEKGEVSVTLSQDDPYIRIAVEDTGMGIPAEHQDRIFERFYVADKSRSRKIVGSGLGLAIVKHIVQLHHGSVSVESSPNCGTRFIVLLPISQP